MQMQIEKLKEKNAFLSLVIIVNDGFLNGGGGFIDSHRSLWPSSIKGPV